MNATITRLSFQAMLGRRRGLVMLIVPVVLLALAGAVRAATEAGTGASAILSSLGLHLGVPLVALLAASAVLGPEVDDGSVIYLLAKPVNRYVVGLSKYVVAAAATVVFGAVPLAIAALINDVDRTSDALGYLVGGTVAGLAYTALFLALCAVSRQAVVIGLLYVVLWESVLGGLLSGVARTSIGSWADRIVAGVSDHLELSTGPGLVYSVIASVLVTVAGVAVTGWQLSRFTMTSET